MRPVSADFLALLRTSHLVTVQAVIEPPTGDPVTVPVVGGHVSMDRTAIVRRRGSLTVPWTLEHDPDDPIDLSGLVFGGYVVLRRGVRKGGGETEYADLGRLRIDSISSRLTDGTATFELSDRMQQVAEEKLLSPFRPTGKATDAIYALVHDVFGDAIAYHLLTTPVTEPTIVDAIYREDRERAVMELAKSINAEAYFDAAGDFVLAPLTYEAPVWTIDVGASGVLIDADESLDRTETYNGVAVIWQASANAPQQTSLATDTDTASETYWGGPFGRVVRVLNTTAIQSATQADALAASELDKALAIARSTTVSLVPNPALEPGDVVTLDFGNDRTEEHVVLGINVPLAASETVELVTRAVDRSTAKRALRDATAWQEMRLAAAV